MMKTQEREHYQKVVTIQQQAVALMVARKESYTSAGGDDALVLARYDEEIAFLRELRNVLNHNSKLLD